MARRVADMAAREGFRALLVALRNEIFTRHSCLIRDLCERRLSARTPRDNIWRLRAMCNIDILRVTCLFTYVFPAVKNPLTQITAVEDTLPLAVIAPFRFLPLRTWHRLALPATVATRVHHNLARTTKALVTWSRAFVLATGHHIPADLATAPSGDIVGFDAAPRERFFPAKAALNRPHVRTWWTRPGMACQLARMWALLRQSPRLCARLAAGMWRYAGYWLGFELLAAPASVGNGESVVRKIAAGAAPLTGAGIVLVHRLTFWSHSGSLVLGPFLYTTEVEDGPATRAAPNFGVFTDFICADRTLVEPVGNVLMSTRGNVRSCRPERRVLARQRP